MDFQMLKFPNTTLESFCLGGITCPLIFPVQNRYNQLEKILNLGGDTKCPTTNSNYPRGTEPTTHFELKAKN